MLIAVLKRFQQTKYIHRKVILNICVNRKLLYFVCASAWTKFCSPRTPESWKELNIFTAKKFFTVFRMSKWSKVVNLKNYNFVHLLFNRSAMTRFSSASTPLLSSSIPGDAVHVDIRSASMNQDSSRSNIGYYHIIYRQSPNFYQ